MTNRKRLAARGKVEEEFVHAAVYFQRQKPSHDQIPFSGRPLWLHGVRVDECKIEIEDDHARIRAMSVSRG